MPCHLHKQKEGKEKKTREKESERYNQLVSICQTAISIKPSPSFRLARVRRHTFYHNYYYRLTHRCFYGFFSLSLFVFVVIEPKVKRPFVMQLRDRAERER